MSYPHLATLLTLLFTPLTLFASPQNPSPLKLGVVSSLTSFAANYGTAVLEGAQVAVDELAAQNVKIELAIEDDQSEAKNAVTAYSKLRNIHGVSAIIGGTWWANAIVKQAERDRLPLISCETLYNDDVVLGDTYFILHGDLRNWIREYEPLINKKGWKRGAIVRYVSGFGATLAREFESIFSRDGRTFAGAVEYSNIDLSEAADIVLKLRRLNPDVIYIDAQPAGLANLLKRLAESGVTATPILTHSIGDDVRRDKLFDLTRFKEFYFTKRGSYESKFEKAFKEKFHKAPYLNADLGYSAVYLAVAALKSADPVATIKQGLSVNGQTFGFDSNNVYSGLRQHVYTVAGIDVTEVK
jgi:branched-chain amino acid transport system substrate-binding protein